MSWRSDSSQLFAGKWTSSLYAGHGVQAQNIPATGDSGPSFLYNDIAAQGMIPTDELRGQILTLPAAGTFTPYEDSSFSFTGAPDGVYTFTYRGFRNGVSYGDYTVTMTIGSNEYQLDAAGGTFGYSGGAATLTYSSAPASYELSADGPLFNYLGGTTSLRHGRLLQADGGAFCYSGGNANLIYGNTLQADGGTFTYSGGNAVFARTYLLQAAGGSFSISGGFATLNYSAAVYSRISGYTIGYAQSPVSAEYANNKVGI